MGLGQPRWRLASAALVLVGIALFFSRNISPRQLIKNSTGLSFNYSRPKTWANSTLGFQQIIAVSGEDPSKKLAWRRKTLVGAANRTGITLHIEELHNLPEAELEYVHNITLQNGNHPKGGSAKAWAGHTRVLRRIVKEKITSALVMEDDVDWEVGVREQLAPSGDIASAIRRLSISDPRLDTTSWPYGDNYDLVWLGHCGKRSQGKFGYPSTFNVTFPDPLVFPMNTYAAWDGKPVGGVPEGHRQVRMGSEVLCTLAYGITWQGAQRLLERLDGHPGHGAFDIEMTDSCSYGTLRCLSVFPELMHDAGMQGGAGSLIHSKTDGSAQKYEDMKLITWNVRYSARCNAGLAPENLKQCLPQKLREAQQKQREGKA